MTDKQQNKKIIVTGAAGFIGLHLAKSLLNDGYTVLGIDNMNDYYDPSLKQARLNQLTKYSEFSFAKIDIADLKQLDYFFSVFQPDRVVNLAAQAGVRYSLENPHAYIESNVKGFMNILECCRHHKTKGLIYASSSSVYGGNEKIPFSVDDRVDHPISIYAATKKSNELMAHTYSHLYGLHTTGLRFFTVYGPWGRPDMAMNIFANKIHNGESIPVFNHGNMKRDFTYIDDIIAGTRSAIEFNAKNEIYNLGNNNWENLMDMVALLEKSLGEKAIIDFQDIQPGDVEKTYANISKSKQDLEYEPTTSLDIGIPKFIQWFKEYNDI
ncbi:MAG: SDR family NAD(P)-dependent oxidoreductase [Candidatus Marinimicrobia bacterium]|jgi:UDP-glucuronate 4-epimerase|nr:SDR family NAD(P)-dependent oxidoreductase [Candidatus Neomarinimicrobiota bacterium]MBT3937667.1 SDR family NAD(P)-dependent oxidoreductase [Candidatus Neomarinimicrobiota bacterium]MBT3960423.1 SDR family NAD(P)-dependent oxidoreductase [Candidatus Neomarinimicrobiota bacterium]MBT6113494.1 SDR family NAD(P)-dependent oxidoreductase [Candidatus Neomarinimicrobiota bacterium]MBT6937914.1 SDR family NAD(P)-dependent oxidoreductase [Candidatus Neomarinimicrobiota bacterium]